MTDAERLALVFKTYAVQWTVAEELLLDLDVVVRREDFFGQYLFQLRTRILADELPPHRLTERTRVPFEVPASTWQMWKARHARRWYARRLVVRWPVLYGPDPDGRGTDAVCTFDLERYRTYPRARVQLPQDRFGAEVLAHSIRGLNWQIGGDDV
ncbi:hypothetical protein AB0F46_41285 [Streptomyces sp. NPDC026665]|uniref:hypothetical protein n=1 Tax=Streptomyces sp. NPDC026665 TaxID=3154798 RepID=UPI0033CBD8F2